MQTSNCMFFLNNHQMSEKNTPVRTRLSVNTPLGKPSIVSQTTPGNISSNSNNYQSGLVEQQQTTTSVLDLINPEETLKNENSSLRFQLDSLEEQYRLQNLQHEASIRELEAKYNAEAKRAETCETNNIFLIEKRKECLDRLETTKSEFSKRETELNEVINELRVQVAELQDRNQDLSAEISRLNSQNVKSIPELTSQLETTVEINKELQAQLDSKIEALTAYKSKTLELEDRITELEDENKVLKSQASSETSNYETIESELSKQMQHISKLELELSEKNKLIRRLKDNEKIVAVVEQEKQDLERKLSTLESLRAQVVDRDIKIADLESQQIKWTSFFNEKKKKNNNDNNNKNEDEDDDFKSPEELVKKFFSMKIQRANLAQQYARVQEELKLTGPTIEEMRNQIDKLDAELAETRELLEKESSGRLKFQRQRDLARMEIKMLTERLEFYDSQMRVKNTASAEQNMSDIKAPEMSVTEVEELKKLVDKYRAEVEKLSKELDFKQGFTSKDPFTNNGSGDGNNNLSSPLKRKATPFSSNERISQLSRKVNTLQNELDQTTIILETRTKELEASTKQLELLESKLKLLSSSNITTTTTEQNKINSNNENSGIRILELRNNPVARHEAIKMEILKALKKENQDLKDQISEMYKEIEKIKKQQSFNNPSSSSSLFQSYEKSTTTTQKLVPYSSLEAVRAEMNQLTTTIADQRKSMDRLKTIFSKKSLEFRESVYGLLGYRVDLLPNKKVKATSIFPELYKSNRLKRDNNNNNKDNNEEEMVEEEEEVSFVFVPSTIFFQNSKTQKKEDDDKSNNNNNQSLKMFSSIEDGPSTKRFKNLVTFWITERRDIPCFLAAVNLELYEKCFNNNNNKN